MEELQTITLKNEFLSITIHRHGAELTHLKRGDTEYLWQADPAFWKRHSPVLFPIVGSVWEGKFRMDGREYAMSQHGFARDMDFDLAFSSDSEAVFELRSSEETMLKFPREFVLQIRYSLCGREIDVHWCVKNCSTKQTLDFQIGAHPAFYYRSSEGASVKGYFSVDCTSDLHYQLIGEKGCADVAHDYPLQLDAEGLLPITASTFERDALIVDDAQVRRVTLHDSQKRPYLQLRFTAPLVGLWAPSPASPVVCIEPWYGRCDRVGFTGEFCERDWVNHLAPEGEFNGGYTIEIL